MKRVSSIVAMLAQGGETVSKIAVGGGAVAAAAGAAFFAPVAHASELDGTITNSTFGFYTSQDPYVETFSVSTTGYVDQENAHEYDFTLARDSAGNNTLSFTDDFGSAPYGAFGTGVNSGAGASVGKFDFIDPAVYNDTPFSLTPATYVGDNGTTLTLSAAPEPEAWALLIAGAAFAGAGLRGARRRQADAAGSIG